MPKAAMHHLTWDQPHNRYILRLLDGATRHIAPGDDAAFQEWAVAQTAFAFDGRKGHLSLLCESRPHSGTSYWYAYRRQGQRTRKKYIGRSADLTLARLEDVAEVLVGKQVSSPMGNQAARNQGNHKGLPLQTDAADGSVGARFIAPNPMPNDPLAIIPSPPLLMPKLCPPRLPASLVLRPRLLERLDAGLEHKVMILAAPAGYGKTTLAHQWIADRSMHADFPPVAWVALDIGDNDPVRFWRYVMTACETFAPGIAQAALAQLATRNRFKPASLEAALTTLLNALTLAGCRGVLVLEDLHVITAPEAQASITFFLDHVPPALHVLIMARGTLPFAVARLGALDDYGGIYPPDLCFTLDETRAFLQPLVPFPLDDARVQQVHARVRGWPAGLRILAIALQRQSPQAEAAHFLDNFAGGQRPVVDYFVTEVLNNQPLGVQDFLLRTSVLPRLSGPLCDAVTTCSGSRDLLENLFAADLFLEPLDGAGDWYRYHALFADAMQHEAQHRLGADALRSVNQRASEWYAQQDMLPEAIEAALRAGMVGSAVDLIQRIIGPQPFQIGGPHTIEFHTLCRWMEQIPESMLRHHPNLCLAYASVLLVLTQTQQRPLATTRMIEALLQMAENEWMRDGDMARRGEVLAFRALSERQRGALTKSVALAHQALALLPENEESWRSCCLGVLAMGEMAGGQLATARGLLTEARTLSARSGNVGFTRANTGMLSAALADQGELHLAAASFRQMLAESRAQEDRDDISHAQLCLAGLAYEWNQLDDAWAAANEALIIGEDFANDELCVHASLTLARIEYARGQPGAAQDRLAALLVRIQPQISPLHQQLHRTAFAWQVRLALRSGELAPAQRWVAARKEDPAAPLALRFLEAGNLARLLMAQDDGAGAREVIAPLLALAQQTGRVRAALEMQVILALAHAVTGDQRAARHALHAALTTAHAEGYLRIFLDEGAALHSLLHGSMSHLHGKSLTTYAQALLHAFVQEHGAAAIPAPAWLGDPLTPQELRVLHLLAAGNSNPVIAQELVVSVNTVKAHIKSIYRKLQVSNRLEATTTAKALQLL